MNKLLLMVAVALIALMENTRAETGPGMQW